MSRVTLTTLLAALLSVAGVSQAATIPVNSTADNLTAGDGFCTIREAIQNANIAAGGDVTGGDCIASTAGTDEVVIPPGVYALTLAGSGEDSNATGDLDLLEPMRIRGSGPASTILDGQSLDRLIHVQSIDTVQIESMTLRNGSTGTDDGGAVLIDSPQPGIVTMYEVTLRDNQGGDGGAVAVFSSVLEVLSSILLDNDADLAGGAIYVNAVSTAELHVEQSEIRGNTSQRSGGGISVTAFVGSANVSLVSVSVIDNAAGGSVTSRSGGGLNLLGSVDGTIDGCEFRGNTTEGTGGAINHEGDSLDVIGGTFEQNTADFEGGAFWLNPGAGDLVTIDQATIRLNQSDSNFINQSGGGGIHCDSGDLLLTNSLIEDNVATQLPGGGLSTATSGTVEIRDSGFRRNTAPSGGGIYDATGILLERSVLSNNEAQSSGGGFAATGFTSATTRIHSTSVVHNQALGGGAGGISAGAHDVEIRHSTISSNFATGRGGGILVGNSASVILEFSTVTNNTAPQGDGGGIAMIAANAVFESKNSMITGNDAAAGDCFQTVPGMLSSHGHNLDGDGSCFGSGPGDIVSGVAHLGPLQNNGGFGPTHALLFPSDAIDAADPACRDLLGQVQTADQRAVPRPLDGDGNGSAGCDIGAFEGPTLNPLIPPPVPDGTFGVPFRIDRNVIPSRIDIDWDVSLCNSTDFNLIYGELDDVSVYNVVGSECGLGFQGTADGITVPGSDLWFLVVAVDANDVEGSWGQASDGTERSGLAHSGECGVVVRDNGGTCP